MNGKGGKEMSLKNNANPSIAAQVSFLYAAPSFFPKLKLYKRG